MRVSLSKAKSVCFIAPHFGSFPAWIALTLGTFAKNPEFELVVVTDQETHHFPDYPNIRFHHQTLEDLESLSTLKLGTTVTLKKGYKVCDLRPAFGVIFADKLEGYDYWGHLDLDTFWGNMSLLLNPILSENYDVICGTSCHVGGPFCIYKNRPLVNELFQQNPHCARVFRAEKNVNFNEIGVGDIKYQGFDQTVREAEATGKIRVYRQKQLYLQDFDSSWWLGQARQSAANAGFLSDSAENKQFEYGTGLWQAGRITELANEDCKDYVFYHFLDGKRRLFRPFPIGNFDDLESFSVGLEGIQLNYRLGFYWFYHRLEIMAIGFLRFVVYDLGPVRHKMRDLKSKFRKTKTLS